MLRLAIAGDGKTLVSSGEDRAVKAWDLPDLKPRADLGAQPDWPQAVALSPEASRIAVGRYDGSVALLDAASGKVVATLRAAPKPGPIAEAAGRRRRRRGRAERRPVRDDRADPTPRHDRRQARAPGRRRRVAVRGEERPGAGLRNARSRDERPGAHAARPGRPRHRPAPRRRRPRPSPCSSRARPATGRSRLIVSDAQLGGDGGHAYRIRAGVQPHVASVYPAGHRAGQGHGDSPRRRESRRLDRDRSLGRRGGDDRARSRPLGRSGGSSSPRGSRRPSRPMCPTIPPEPWRSPGPAARRGGSTRRETSTCSSSRRRRGARVIVEVFGRRLGSPIDPAIEILDAKGRPVPRAVLRPVEETNVAFRDHASTSRDDPPDEVGRPGDRRLPARRPRVDAALGAARGTRTTTLSSGASATSGPTRASGSPSSRRRPSSTRWASRSYKVEIHPPGRDLPAGRHAAGHADLPERRRRPRLRQGLAASPSTRRPTGRTSSASRTSAAWAGPITAITWSSARPGPTSAISLSTDDPERPARAARRSSA